MGETKIEWTATVNEDGTVTPGATWNPIRARRKDGKPNLGGGGWACQRVSDGCLHCYAADLNRKRFGTGLDYDAKGLAASDIYLDEKVLLEPLRWRTPRRVFPCSMTDMFGEWVEYRFIVDMFAVMVVAYWCEFQVLTKRPERAREMLNDPEFRRHVAVRARELANRLRGSRFYLAHQAINRWLLDGFAVNVWMGTSVENQREADRRIPELLATPAAVRFLSCEPLLEDIRLRAGIYEGSGRLVYGTTIEGLIDWVIVGGESGPGARPCDVAWIRSIVQQSQAAGVACFVKQLGRYPVERDAKGILTWPDYPLRDRKGGDIAEFPEALRVREWPR